jgi:hypothetical protein
VDDPSELQNVLVAPTPSSTHMSHGVIAESKLLLSTMSNPSQDMLLDLGISHAVHFSQELLAPMLAAPLKWQPGFFRLLLGLS